MLALDDVRILDLTRLLPGGFCTMLLADCGADVIKIENVDGADWLRWVPPLVDGNSAMFYAINRNKRSIKLNLKTAGGREAFLRLAESADVVVESFRPGVMERLGIGFATLHERNPKLVVCSISGYGQDGPYRDRAGHDLNYAALAGVLSITACDDGDPALPGLQVGDLGAGATHAAVAILAALHQRERTGEGQHCDIAMLDGLISWLSINAAPFLAGQEAPGPGTLMLNGKHPCYRIYRCADGHLALAALEPKFWRNFVEAIGLAHLAESGLVSGEEARRVVTEVQETLMLKTRAQWMATLDGRDVCCEPLLRLDEVFEQPQVRHRGMRLEAGDAGPVDQCGFPLRLSESPMQVRRRAPGFGEHTREVLAEAGYDDAAIASLLAEGATA